MKRQRHLAAWVFARLAKGRYAVFLFSGFLAMLGQPASWAAFGTSTMSGELPSAMQAQPIQLQSLIPETLNLSSGQSFHLHDEGAATFDAVVANSPEPATAERQLRDWGWAENYYRVFAADNPPRSAAGWVELSIDRFDSVDGAAQALVTYADARRSSHNEQGIDLGLFSDQSEAMSGPAYNGNEVTIFARRGDLVVRATGITPVGDPTKDVAEALLKILVPIADEPRVISSNLFNILPTDANMPAGLRLTEEHARSGATLADGFPNPKEAERLFQGWGWRESASRIFTGGTLAGTTQFEAVVFRLNNPAEAAQALDYFLRARAMALHLTEVTPANVAIPGMREITGPIQSGREATVYFCNGSNLLRLTAIGSKDPMIDLMQIVESMLTNVSKNLVSNPTSSSPPSAKSSTVGAESDVNVVATLQAQIIDLQGQAASLEQQNAQLATEVSTLEATSPVTASTDTTSTAPILPTPRSEHDGQTRAEAIPVGQFGRVAGWQVMVQSYIPDATNQVLAARPDIPPPSQGTQFVIVNVQLVNLAREDHYSGGNNGLVIRAVGNPMQGNEYTLYDSGCRNIAGDVSDTLVRAESGVKGVLCFQIRSSDVSSLALLVQSQESYADFVWLSVS